MHAPEVRSMSPPMASIPTTIRILKIGRWEVQRPTVDIKRLESLPAVVNMARQHMHQTGCIHTIRARGSIRPTQPRRLTSAAQTASSSPTDVEEKSTVYMYMYMSCCIYQPPLPPIMRQVAQKSPAFSSVKDGHDNDKPEPPKLSTKSSTDPRNIRTISSTDRHHQQPRGSHLVFPSSTIFAI